jgi:ParB/RepB/Spo0J family partition protein
MKIADITMGVRQRQDLGDIAGLAKSIEELGLLQPIVVTPDRNLVAGRRRLEAVKELQWTEVPVRVAENLTDALALLKAEQDENKCRKDFTPSEAVAMGRAIEVLEKEAAKKRQQASQTPKGEKVGAGKLPTPIEGKGRTRDKVAEAVGMSGRNYEKAKAVVEAAEDDPVACGPIKDEMDRTGKVDPAHRKMKEIVEAAVQEPDKYGDLLTKLEEGKTDSVHEKLRERKKAHRGNGKLSPRRRRGKAPLPEPKIKGLVKALQVMVDAGDLPAGDLESWLDLRGPKKMSVEKQNELAGLGAETIRRQLGEWGFLQKVNHYADSVIHNYQDPLKPPAYKNAVRPWEPEKITAETKQKAVAHLEKARAYLDQMIQKLK